MPARLPRITQLRRLLAFGGQRWQQPTLASECRLLEHLQSRGAAASAAQARPDTRQHWRPVPAARQLPWGQQCHAASNAAAAASNVADDQDRTVSGQAPEAALPAQQPAGASHSADGPQPYTARGASSSAASSGTFQGASVEQASGSATAGADASSSDAHQEQQRQQQQGPGAGFDARAAAEEAKRRAEQAKQAAAGWLARAQGVLRAVSREVTDVILPQTETVSATKRRAEGLQRAEGGSTAADVMVVEQPETLFQRRWKQLRERFGHSPMFKRLEALGASLGDNPALRRSRELREDLRDRWETSDSPLVHRIQDMSDNMFTETEMARAYREVQVRDPSFDMVSFLQRLRADVPVIVRAYLLGQVDVLAEHCAPQMVEQLSAIIRAQQAQGQFTDATLLDVSEVELADVKFLENDPVIVVQFNCQQINCVRDKFGNVVDGSPEDLQRVYYYWAIQQDPAGFVGVDGKHYPPRWQLREMLVRGMHALIG